MKKTRKQIPSPKKNMTNKARIDKCVKSLKTRVKKKINMLMNITRKQIKNSKNKDEIILLKKTLTHPKKIETEIMKSYKQFNCNINCKNTILEAGPSNKLPLALYNRYKHSKVLLKFMQDKRKVIFGNKTNVLVDSFYENTPKKTKDKLIKEGSISECRATN